MSDAWTINAEWEPLDAGSPEERAGFASIAIQARGIWLTEGLDALSNSLRKAPRLSAYSLAEWLAWNWWRLRWEPRSTSANNWSSSHRLATIGGGYIWPNITIFSDGERIALIAKPTEERPQTPFRYIANFAAVIQGHEFENITTAFIEQVLQRLDSERVRGTNLETVWNGVTDERRSPELARIRKLEALLGQEPDESNPQVLEQLIADSKELSNGAIDEIAADHGSDGAVVTATELREIAEAKGYDASPRNAVGLSSRSDLPRPGGLPAWRYGAIAAKLLREQESLDGTRIPNRQLTELAGAQSAVLDDKRGGKGFSFALDDSPTHSRVVLRSKWTTGRRFELARLIGDRIVKVNASRLFPATQSSTYRQKMQRSFAAEFLSPFDVVEDMLKGDYSTESQQEVAEHFEVSPLTIRTMLTNHKRIEREGFDEDFDALVA
ncbi:MAG TPA: hypothetical protein VGC77_15325 [Rhodopseudomonas sp.]|uniref:hypothetical protein n=1 Tax=Rhodopseudomonas sp. TaxID=1078 RepID=UPI002ED971FD